VGIPSPIAGGTEAADSAPALSFSVERVEPLERAAAPTLLFGMRIVRTGGAPVRSVALNVQLRIAATRRAYDGETRERLAEVFGAGDAWGRNLHSLPWTSISLNVPGFEDETIVDLQVPCTYDFEVATSKYLHGLRDGEVPLELLFSGTVFYTAPNGGLQVSLVPWEKEAQCRMPVSVWRQLMDHYFPGGAWLRLGSETFDRLYAFRSRNALPNWDRAIDRLLDEADDA
jgi:Family of unknown function (DUF6084)